MEKLYVEVDNGVEALLRVVGVLRRKDFDVVSVNLQSTGDQDLSDLYITLDEKFNLGAENAKNQMEKLFGVHSVKIL